MSESTNSGSISPRERYFDSVGGSATDESTSNSILSPFRVRLIFTDLVLLALAMGFGLFLSSKASAWAIDPILAIYGVPVAITILWWALLALRGSYDQRIIGLGTEEIRRVVSASLYTFALVAGTSYLFRADISRAYAFISLPLGLVMITAGRFCWRNWLYHQRESGRFVHRTLLIGSGLAAEDLNDRFLANAHAGYEVVARYSAPQESLSKLNEVSESWLEELGELLKARRCDAVAITSSESLTSGSVRQIAWYLEGRPVDLLIAPAMMDTGGTRITVRPAAGLPLIHLDEAALSRPQRFAKRFLDCVGALIAILLLSPLFVLCAIWVRINSRGPILFKQERIGRAGTPFTMLKFRTMVIGADSAREELRIANQANEPMFKMKNDPRITSAGRFLRRWSLDELPQLFNVLGGSMSLVGPRPHPLDDVDRYELEAFRRLALKPGMTGLWQVEGRSNLSWQAALQLDLYYVETWSLSGDLVLLTRTIRAVAQGRGAS